ncbi:MAG: M67 family metallopeptidase [Deltaproteobacteria bacterium]|nr:M67 family metallopeptidase [Deltaproteobacteria bacterium]MBW2152425.1 M67 family metallopeptidase [Deltaproteobacteria bacterium]
MTSEVFTGLIDHAKSVVPIEACGYLASRNGIVVYQYRLKNLEYSAVHFTLDPQDQFEALKDMQKKEAELAAVYHSHPVTAAWPSKEDIRLAYDPDISYVIVSLYNGVETIKAFRIRNHAVQPEEIQIVQAPPEDYSSEAMG